MFEKGILVGLYAETSLHPGTGTTTGVVDLPVQRDRHTEFPIIHGSSLKGAMREKAEAVLEADIVNIIFGPDNSRNNTGSSGAGQDKQPVSGAGTNNTGNDSADKQSSDHAGSISISDARLLAFPVRSLKDVFLWVTCPLVLNRFKRDLSLLTIPVTHLENLSVANGDALVVTDSGLTGAIVLEDLSFTVNSDKTKADNKSDNKTAADKMCKWLHEILKLMPSMPAHTHITEKMAKNLIVISDDDYKHLVKTATQVNARIVLDENKTSDNLWYEESLPSDCLFYTIVLAMKPRVKVSHEMDTIKVMAEFQKGITGYLQVGGNETVGMGWCAVQFFSASNSENKADDKEAAKK